ncbi:LysR family transcriptional regulator [Alcaligenaceae bacterium]|nr:LysR family transcriptional regulator [Alcaligenaceae bacterium]
MNNISLRQLRAFQEVARAQSFSGAAAKLFITRSALSETIKQLELQLGVRLLDRTTRSVQLSTTGIEFYEEVNQVLSRLNNALQRLDDINSIDSGHVRIAGAPSMLHGIVIPSLSQLRRTHPNIKVTLHELGANGISDHILQADVDFGVGALNEEHITQLSCLPLLKDRFVVIAPVGHELLNHNKRGISIADLGCYPYIGLTSDTLIGRVLSATSAAPENVREPIIRVSNTSLLCSAIENGLGVSILTSLSMKYLKSRKIGSTLLSDPLIERDIQMFWRSGRSLSPVAKLVWNEIYLETRKLKGEFGITLCEAPNVASP